MPADVKGSFTEPDKNQVGQRTNSKAAGRATLAPLSGRLPSNQRTAGASPQVMSTSARYQRTLSPNQLESNGFPYQSQTKSRESYREAPRTIGIPVTTETIEPGGIVEITMAGQQEAAASHPEHRESESHTRCKLISGRAIVEQNVALDS